LLGLWAWDEATFLRQTEGSAIRRIGFGRWQRNLAVAMGNALRQRPLDEGHAQHQAQMRAALSHWLMAPTPGADVALVTPHVQWALLAST
jgi:epoxyqueuosine reductase